MRGLSLLSPVFNVAVSGAKTLAGLVGALAIETVIDDYAGMHAPRPKK